MIAIKMDMPKTCGDCKLCSRNYACIPLNRATLRDEKPNWCPLRDVRHLCVERIYPHEDVVMVPNDKLLKYAMGEIGRKIGEYIVDTPEVRVIQSTQYNTNTQSDACCDLDCDSVKLRADVWVVEPEVDVT